MKDQIVFKSRMSLLEDYQVLDIYINGFNLIDILKEMELPFASIEGHPQLAGHYEGIPPLICLPPSKHFWGQPSMKEYDYKNGRVALYENKSSGIPGEWTITAQIDVDGEAVRWSALQHVQRPKWDYRPVNYWAFDLVAYRDALANVIR